MPITLHEIIVPPFIRALRNLSLFLHKGETWANEQGAEHDTLLNARLFPDMKDLIYQIQRVSDTAKYAAVRVAGAENVALPDEEKTFADLYARIDKTIEILEMVQPEAFTAGEARKVTIKLGAGEFRWDDGKAYLLTYAVPNFYFHETVAYGLLRKMGVPVGKVDYLGKDIGK